MPTQVRPGRPDDAPVIANLNVRLAKESENEILDPETVHAGVAAALADPSKGRYFLAVEAGKVVGQLMLTTEWSDWRNGAFWWIQSVYVLPEHRSGGVFSMLYRHVQNIAHGDPQVCGLRLYVDRDNFRAKSAYRTLGMGPSNYEVMELEFEGRAT
jgi:ribosomal protein S18 acetylase RimI-like enzyme